MSPLSHTYRARSSQAGFTLIEMIIIIFLAGIMMFCVAKLTSETLKSMKFLQEKSSTTEAANLACQRVAAELREAVSISNTGSTVVFHKVKPSAPLLVGNNLSTPNWEKVYSAGNLARITYSFALPKVLRQVNSESPLEVATTAAGFSVEQYTLGREGAYRVRLSIQELRRVIVFESIAISPGLLL